MSIIGKLFDILTGKSKKRREIMNQSFPDHWERIVKENVELYNYLPEGMKEKLKRLILVFLDEKKFEGCGGLEITDEIRVTIAAHACILLLGKKDHFFPKLYKIGVYPGAYSAPVPKNVGGAVVEENSVRLGESWLNGKLILAWDHVAQGKYEFRDGQNVVLHEFAHQLDQEDNSSDGAPILEDSGGYVSWASVFSAEYEKLQKNVRRRVKSVMDEYGATDPAEFFAVATETFFEKPIKLKRKHPELYRELRKFYKLDPVSWFSKK